MLGVNAKIWKDFCELFSVAIPVIEQEFFGPEEVVPANANTPPTASMTMKDAILMKDLERLNDLLTIARNMLATTKRAQNLAGDSGFDQQVLKLIDICVRVTARAYEGEEPGRRTENQLTLLNASCKFLWILSMWTKSHWLIYVRIVKKVLITSLQFLHNFVMYNEKRKLLLWLDLFANSKTADHYFGGNGSAHKDQGALSMGAPEVIISKEIIHHSADKTPLDVDKIMRTALSAVESSAKNAHHLPPDEAACIASQVMSTVDGLYNLTLDRGRKPPQEGQHASAAEQYASEATISTQINGPGQNQSWSWTSLPDLTMYDADARTSNPKVEDLKAVRTPQSAAASLQSAKDQLMARLQDPAAGFGNEGAPYPSTDQENGGDAEGSDVAANGSVGDEGDDPDGDYRGPGDQERGLLTDIPLVLAPQEIEALPMIIQAGIVNNPGTKGASNSREPQDMQGVRCNILLAQESGRNLLRELLIFIAAWDLQDNEFYFKMMMQIMEAILENGLMPFAYQAFGEVKDIVSPAQSMVIKILTQIFRGKQGTAPSTSGPAAPTRQREPLTRVDLLIVKYIFTIFRQCIIPETCALIYLQGQIRAGAAQPDDFPLNLWDMERVYEGVYQFLEFFAVLTESEDWKGLLVEWEIVSELVTLLRELDGSIPKAPLGAAPPTVAETEAEVAAIEETQSLSAPQPVAVERPYDMPAPSDPPAASATASAPYSVPPSPPLDTQEPSDFEWRNLKKLVVLVLSSLVWKSTTVQNQIRQYGGVEMILQCCHLDSNNPYIREHAIMCLRFLLEGNRENQQIVGELEARRTVPEEVLDKRGYETYIDGDGKVGLRARERIVAAPVKRVADT